MTPVLAERLRLLFRHDLALAAYHIPLDAHPEVGNNAILANALGWGRHEPFGSFKGTPVGRIDHFDGDGLPADELFARVHEVTGREPTVFDGARTGSGASGSSPDRPRTCSRRRSTPGLTRS